ncbi:MAG: DUF417 family protein [Myxococcaceae bacterium]
MRALRRARALDGVGAGMLRLGLALLLALFGTFKFFRPEAEALVPVVHQSPLVAWTYLLFSVRTAAALMGSVEVAAALGLLCSSGRAGPPSAWWEQRWRACGSSPLSPSC